ncbi:hypothetical protein I5I61_25355 [Pseudomonas nitroreducens]|uniref:Phage tail protein n=1 Tax=Pseudomonas nitroreducens TaxID=46680 RepID=A0ABS0KS59_PSENT|nr:hypothetical protein [Pseudomonas nitroreducens]MBG6290799.1 hypothetical protein [Pseudomonas nitroreducens]
MANVQHLVTGSGAPTAAPPAVGAHYVDTVAKKTYIATGTASEADWGSALSTGSGGGGGGVVLPITSAETLQYAGEATVQVDFTGVATEAILQLPDLRAFDLLLTGANITPDGRHLLIQGQGSALESVWMPDSSTLVTATFSSGSVRVEVGQGEALYRAVRTGGTLSLYRLGEWTY